MKDDRLYLLHIRDALQRVTEYTLGGREAFFADQRTQDAVIRNLEVMGEAAKSVSLATRERAPQIRWKDIAGMRDKLIHEYFGVNLEIVWRVVERDAPLVQRGIEDLLLSMPESGQQ